MAREGQAWQGSEAKVDFRGKPGLILALATALPVGAFYGLVVARQPQPAGQRFQK